MSATTIGAAAVAAHTPQSPARLAVKRFCGRPAAVAGLECVPDFGKPVCWVRKGKAGLLRPGPGVLRPGPAPPEAATGW